MTKKRKFNHGDAISRARKAYEYFETDNPACSVCGENRPAILEKHHIAGRAYDPATMILCRNHHGLMTEMQKDFPSDTGNQSNSLECFGRLLLNLAALFELLVGKFKEIGLRLIELAQSQSSESDQ